MTGTESLVHARRSVEYDGEFWLAWLLPDSRVMSAGDGSGAAVVVAADGTETRIDIGTRIEVPL